MEVHHSSTEEELGLLSQRGDFADFFNQYDDLASETEVTESVDGDSVHHDLEIKHDIESGDGFEEDHSFDGRVGFSSIYTLSTSRGPGSEPGGDTGTSGDRDVEDGSNTTQRWGKGGLCHLTQEKTEQAASEEVQPQTKKNAQNETSRTQSHSSKSIPPEKISDFSQDNANDISLHLLRTKPPERTQDFEDIIRALQKRPSVNFEGKIPNTLGNVKKRDHHRTPKKSAYIMGATSTPAKKRDLPVSASGDDGSPQKKPKVIATVENDKTKDSDDDDQWDNYSCDSSDNDRFYQRDTPPSDRGEASTAAAAVPTKSSAKKPKVSKKKGRQAEYKPVPGESTTPAAARKNMLDRYNTLDRNAKFTALHNAILKHVKSPEEKQEIASSACEIWHKVMEDNIKDDKNPEEMAMYHQASMKPPDYAFDKDCKIQKRSQNDHQLTNVTSLPQSQNVTGVDVNEWRKGLPFYDAEHTTGGGNTEGGTTIVGKHKFEYPIYIAENAQNLARKDDIRDYATQFPESFTDREQANAKLLELTQYENFEGNVAAVTRRNIFEYTPLKLLKAELTLATGEERVFWVDRHLVELKNLTKRQQSSKKWSAKRPALPHFIVECEFMTRSTSETPQQLPHDDDSDVEGEIQMSNEVVGTQTGELELERLPLTTFTDRKLANDHAGALFLRHSAVREEIRTPLDDFWWVNNAVPVHREAEKKAEERDGRYVAELYSMDMDTRLGFDWMRVAVYAVDDVIGPLNI
ncbi:uncharacterized protein GGS22DRAFT_198534 [Annulohypoxylon maeteangense]|uniref:uncharacterized protein n=1 Tax=Annulohypoxylon maeteangense TaxID=1927788 RepID=UPI002007C451|nr:uncharacterized protein GGS22DRAFT_198534 [Annulohypoxylon maeteangense]KAI0887102.1 hypothetical protein GGS22DRAFT_198534 [Annulohypoxylon maeteangense]